MCRLLGIVTSEPTDFKIVLREVPRSLAALSQQHPDGWGLAVFSDSGGLWSVSKGTETAHKDDQFHKSAAGSRGVTLLSHVRLKTVGPTSIENTHPFQSDGWVFAHNGTINDLGFVRSRVSESRMAAIRGDTDSEVFFAWILSEFDRAGISRGGPVNELAVDERLRHIVLESRRREAFGAFNFLLSNGRVMYAHRFGRSLFSLHRGPHDEVRRERTTDNGVTVYTPWSQRRCAVFIASERMTDEPWEEVPEGELLRIDRRPTPALSVITRSSPASIGPVSAA
jgi:glutamine amidotransferase